LKAPKWLSSRPVLDPSIPFSVHTAEGEVVDVRVAGQTLAGAGFRPSDPALNGYVVLDFDAFDTWHEEDEVNLGNPRDPFHRIDILQSRTYHDPQREASEVRGLVAFFDERADVVLDGTHLERPMTLVSTSGNLSRSSAGRPRDPARGLISCAMLRGATAPHPG